jgi:hypothetical protein
MVEVMPSEIDDELSVSNDQIKSESMEVAKRGLGEKQHDSDENSSKLSVEGLARLIVEERREWSRVLAEDAQRRSSLRQDAR